MKKKWFTVIELTFIVILLWLIFSMSRNLFNSRKQEKIIFGETCINYLFGEIDKFENDYYYQKQINNQQLSNIFMNFRGTNLPLGTGFPPNLKGEYTVSDIVLWYINTGNNQILLKHIQTYRGVWSILFWTWFTQQIPRPSNCSSPKYLVRIGHQIQPFWDWFSSPSAYIQYTNWKQYFTTWLNQSLNTVNTWSIMFEVCDTIVLAPNWAFGSSSARNCIEIGKIEIDRRIWRNQYMKCKQTNETTWVCGVWPRLN